MLAIWMMLCALPARADVDESTYEAVGAVRGERERQRFRVQFMRELEAERRRAEIEAAEVARIRAEAQTREAARPYPERLTEQRCTLCHPAENYTSKHHTWLYWRLVVARMVWLNEAPIAEGSQAVIAAHLAEVYPARGEEIVIEYGLPAIALAMLSGAAWAGRRFWKGRK
ncbi:MAG: hypothetical protein OHM77_03710 [Candidatus Nitricoxidivorans perseverans]|uniref:Uncharacterized protein n=1 Tax=Candidatus Nitricoxidivorans perseverans TaxID=2975601 RepID=A0AA49IZD0_9PROT|nr:MAG: hypothetical protein OHM77_03710 [Candidatus Nitricoxidivorans perseverans]